MANLALPDEFDFTGNKASSMGGALYAAGSNMSVTAGALFEQNDAPFGGAIYVDSGANVTVGRYVSLSVYVCT